MCLTRKAPACKDIHLQPRRACFIHGTPGRVIPTGGGSRAVRYYFGAFNCDVGLLCAGDTVVYRGRDSPNCVEETLVVAVVRVDPHHHVSHTVMLWDPVTEKICRTVPLSRCHKIDSIDRLQKAKPLVWSLVQKALREHADHEEILLSNRQLGDGPVSQTKDEPPLELRPPVTSTRTRARQDTTPAIEPAKVAPKPVVIKVATKKPAVANPSQVSKKLATMRNAAVTIVKGLHRGETGYVLNPDARTPVVQIVDVESGQLCEPARVAAGSLAAHPSPTALQKVIDECPPLEAEDETTSPDGVCSIPTVMTLPTPVRAPKRQKINPAPDANAGEVAETTPHLAADKRDATRSSTEELLAAQRAGFRECAALLMGANQLTPLSSQGLPLASHAAQVALQGAFPPSLPALAPWASYIEPGRESHGSLLKMVYAQQAMRALGLL